MSGEVMVRHCSPTLAGLKTGSMFSYSFANGNDLRDSVRHWNRVFFGKGLRVLPLCYRNGRALIYVFRPKKLDRDLRDSIACDLLHRCGYCDKDPQKCILHLMKRLNEDGAFPHEVGLFLGYPFEKEIYIRLKTRQKTQNMRGIGRFTAMSRPRSSGLNSMTGVRESTANSGQREGILSGSQ